MFRLTNWHLDIWGDVLMGFGNCFGNPKFSQGYWIHTSRVMEISADEEGRGLHIFTQSGSCYALDFADINETCIECTDRVLQGLGILFDAGKCLMLRQRRLTEMRERVSKILNPGQLYVQMAGGGNVCEAFFQSKEGQTERIPVVRHTSIMENGDSILVTDWHEGSCDWRIFPGEETVRPYHWSEGLTAVWIENVGADFVFAGLYGDIPCKSGEITVIKSSAFTGEGLLSPDAVNGKCLFFDRNGEEETC